MPGFLTHLVVLDRATDRLLADRDARMSAIGRILRDNREAASTGAIGPDVTFFMDAPPVAQALLKAVEYLREFKEKLKPIREGIDDVERFLPNVDRLSGGMISRLGEYFSAAFATIIAAAERFAAREFDVFQYLKLPLQESQREEDWFWFDMLHYRSTGPFSRELITRAGTNAELQAYAYGYMSHLAVDTVGHAFVNSVVGAPYRCLWQRHHTVDNYIDVWAARHYWSREMLASQVYTRYFPRANAESPAAMPSAVADLLVDTTRNVYTGKPHPNGDRMGGREFPNRSDWQNTYRDIYNVLEFSTGGVPMERPRRPEFPDIDVRDLLPPFPHVPGPSDYDDPGVALLALFFWPLYLARAAKEWVEEVVARIMEMAEAPARHIIRLFLYEMQMMLYHTFRAHHRALALRGYVYGYSDELQNDEESGLWRVPRVEANYPHREDTDLWQRPWRWPDSPFEPATSWPGPYPVGSTPQSFIEDAVQSEDVYRGLTAPTGPRDVTGVTAPLISTGGDPRPGLGNAADLFVRMVRSAVDNETIPNFNLDSDRGYGWPCWTWRDGAGGPSSGALADADIEFRRGRDVV